MGEGNSASSKGCERGDGEEQHGRGSMARSSGRQMGAEEEEGTEVASGSVREEDGLQPSVVWRGRRRGQREAAATGWNDDSGRGDGEDNRVQRQRGPI
ncbi:hypothetical protein GW17_00023951, partial [Ensete ventricosum]